MHRAHLQLNLSSDQFLLQNVFAIKYEEAYEDS